MAGGQRCPAPAKKSRKTRKRVAKLFPSEDPWSDRITNQVSHIKETSRKVQILFLLYRFDHIRFSHIIRSPLVDVCTAKL